MSAMPALAAAPAGDGRTDYPVRFLGTGSEYFRIWIVNLLLTIVTIGIYSAWAKVRRLKYFYRNTQIAESSFDYHGSPIAILIGRIFALVLLIAYNFSFQFSLIAGLITIAVLAAIFPWLIRQSLRFRARYSSYRGIHFQFIGGLAEIYMIAAPVILVVVPIALASFYGGDEDASEPPVIITVLFAVALFIYVVLLPYLHYRFKRYQHNNALLGSTAAHFNARPVQFYKIYGLLLGATIGVGAIFVAIGAVAGMSGARLDMGLLGVGVVLMIIVFYLLYLLLFAAFVVLIQNVVWNHTTIGQVSFKSNARMWPLAVIYLVNIVLLILTLGLYTPFAVIRSLKYRLESVTAVSSVGMEQFLAQASSEQIGAAGEGAADLFDFDIGL